MLSGIVPNGSDVEGLPDMWRFEPTTGWHELVTERSPDPWDDSLSYDVAMGIVWLSAFGEPHEIWRLDSITDGWTRVDTGGGPMGGGYFVAFDSESRQLIHFGGYVADDFDNQTWAYGVDTGTWQEMDPAQRPPGRHAASIAYDALSDRVVLYGGWDTGQNHDTWTYDFNTDTWTEMAPDRSPSASSGGSMAFDPAGRRVLLFGGGDPLSDDTWAYDVAGDTWTEIATATRPSARVLAGMAYDAQSGVVVLFGGGNRGANTTRGDTWLFDPATDSWTEWTAR